MKINIILLTWFLTSKNAFIGIANKDGSNLVAKNLSFENTVNLSEAIENFVPQENTKLVHIPNYNRNPGTLRYLDTKQNEIFASYNLVKTK